MTDNPLELMTVVSAAMKKLNDQTDSPTLEQQVGLLLTLHTAQAMLLLEIRDVLLDLRSDRIPPPPLIASLMKR